LKSKREEKYYTGHTNSLERRLVEHNLEQRGYTKNNALWEVVYHETFQTRQEAIDREKYFKSAAGRRWLKKNVNK